MKKRKGTIIIACIIGVVFGALTIYNIFYNSEGFWKISIYHILSLVFVIFISYFLVQKRTDERQKVSMVDKMIEDIQKSVSMDVVVGYETEEDRKQALLYQKSIANRIDYLQKSSVCSVIKEDLEYIKKEMESLREFYGNHMNDKSYMEKSTTDFNKYIVNICDKCYAMRLQIYSLE